MSFGRRGRDVAEVLDAPSEVGHALPHFLNGRFKAACQRESSPESLLNLLSVHSEEDAGFGLANVLDVLGHFEFILRIRGLDRREAPVVKRALICDLVLHENVRSGYAVMRRSRDSTLYAEP